jgi:protoheme IX farnesyltransferase
VILWNVIRNYIGVLKPAASILLTFIGIISAIVANDGIPEIGSLVLIGVAVLIASAGANGLTNYLDRHIDARMLRTKHRALPAGRIKPPEKVLPLTIGLIIIGLVLAWYLQPVYRLAFIADVVGTSAALVWRKRATCVFPQGMLASCAPVLMGWFAIKPAFGWELLLLCGLIGFWLPLHVWSVMLAHRDEYINAGLSYFPISRKTGEIVKLLFILSLALAIFAIGLYFIGAFGLLYMLTAILMSGILVYGAYRLIISGTSKSAWRLYKLSSFPYLGLVFLAIGLDKWLL